MPSGLVALLDDVAGIVRLAAVSIDDATAASTKASSKAIGVVVDDAAVTPRYIEGITPARELPIIWRIAKGSVRNKLLILLPAALLLSAFLPGAITPLLMIGGVYLSYEGAEKIIEVLTGHAHGPDDVDAPILTGTLFEDAKVNGAIRTDLILSAEIMAISLADITDKPFLIQVLALTIVALLITAGVYGAVGFIVKMDDIGLHLAGRRSAPVRVIGRGLVAGMPVVMSLLAKIGTAAMLWVGGGILVHGLEHFHFDLISNAVHHAGAFGRHLLGFAPGFGAWLGTAIASGIVGLIVGAVVAILIPVVSRSTRMLRS